MSAAERDVERVVGELLHEHWSMEPHRGEGRQRLEHDERLVVRGGLVLSAGRHQTVREGREVRLDRRRGLFPQGRPPARPAGDHRQGKAPKDMKNKEDYWEVLEVVPGAPLMQKPDAFGCNLGDYT